MINTGRPLCSPRNWKRPVLLFCQTAARPLQIIWELSFDLRTIITTIISMVITVINMKILSYKVSRTSEAGFNCHHYHHHYNSNILKICSHQHYFHPNLDVMTILSQSGSHVSVSSRSEALGSFSSANLSQ